MAWHAFKKLCATQAVCTLLSKGRNSVLEMEHFIFGLVGHTQATFMYKSSYHLYLTVRTALIRTQLTAATLSFNE